MSLEVEGQITFFYYEDLAKAEEFYGGVMGFEKVINLGFAKVFKMADGAHIGIVDAEGGYHKPSEDKPVMLTVMVEDAEVWHRRLTGKGVETNHPPRKSESLDMTWDPEGYVIEILQFDTKPYG